MALFARFIMVVASLARCALHSSRFGMFHQHSVYLYSHKREFQARLRSRQIFARAPTSHVVKHFIRPDLNYFVSIEFKRPSQI